MAVALTAYEQSLCSSCGFPLSVCGSDDNDGEFEVKRRICHASATIEDLTRPNGEESYKPDLGEKLGIVLPPKK